LKKFNFLNSKGISIVFLVIAMLLMVTIGYVFSYLIPTKQKSVVFPIQSTQAYFIAQSGVEFAVRYALTQTPPWKTRAQLLGLNGLAVYQRNLGAGRFTINYTNTTDTLTSSGEVPTGTERRRITVSNFTKFLFHFFAYRKLITVQANQVSNGPLTNFPMLISITTDNNLRTTVNGGHIYNAATNDPQDLVFEALDDATCGGAGTSPCWLDHEIEYYVPTTGQLIAWVKVPSINNGTLIYMYYGNSCIASSTQNPGGVWTDYSGVWHSGESATPLIDSTGNNNLTTNSTQIAGQIENAQFYNGTTQLASKTAGVVNIPANNTSQTISVWFTIGVRDANTKSGVSFVNPTGAGSGIQFGLRARTMQFWQWGGATLGGNRAYPAVNTWHYMVYTFDGTTHRPYYDNLVLATATTPAAQTGTPSQIYFSTYDGLNEWWNGRIDEVRISNSGIVRSAGWILTEYNNQSVPANFYTVGAEAPAP
jgi:biopolymer transport protein ExbB